MEVKPKLDFADDGLEAKRDGWEENMVVSTMRSNKRVISVLKVTMMVMRRITSPLILKMDKSSRKMMMHQSKLLANKKQCIIEKSRKQMEI